MKFIFKYPIIRRPSFLGDLKAPAIPVMLLGKDAGKPFFTTALVDSGADFSAIHESVARILGLGLSGEKEEIRGISGSAKAVRSKITVVVSNKQMKAELAVEVRVVLGEPQDDFPVLLGRKGFFERFEITINEKEKKIVLKELGR
jgi:hypothetical protein